ncbi:MAG: hypothetical protein Q9167_007010 [Letrouitia subvulpina]
MLRSYAVALASLLSLSVALPQAARPSELSALDCQDLSRAPAPECWVELSMPAWITHWISIQSALGDKSADNAIRNSISVSQVNYPQLLVSLLVQYGNNDAVAALLNQSLPQGPPSAPVSPQTPIAKVHQILNSQLSDVLNEAMTDFDSDVFLTMTAQGALMALPAEDPAYLEGEFRENNPRAVPSR